MKYLAIILAIVTLSGCKDMNNTNQTEDMITICLDDVAYWVDGEGTNYQMMAPRIDPKTLSFVLCKEDS